MKLNIWRASDETTIYPGCRTRRDVTHEREDLLTRYECAVKAYKEATERSRSLTGVAFYEAMLEVDRLHAETRSLERALAEYDKAMR